MAYGGLPFRDTGCLVSNVYIHYVPDLINLRDTVSTFIHLCRVFLSTKKRFEQRIWWYTMGLLYLKFAL